MVLKQWRRLSFKKINSACQDLSQVCLTSILGCYPCHIHLYVRFYLGNITCFILNNFMAKQAWYSSYFKSGSITKMFNANCIIIFPFWDSIASTINDYLSFKHKLAFFIRTLVLTTAAVQGYQVSFWCFLVLAVGCCVNLSYFSIYWFVLI